MKLTELATIIDDFDYDKGIDPIYFKDILSRIGNIDWAEFLTLQSINMYFPEKLTNTKFLNFSDVADPSVKTNKPILLECLLISQQLANGIFEQFSSPEVTLGFCHFLNAYIEDVKANLSNDDIVKIRNRHEELHEELVQKIRDGNPDTVAALSFLIEIAPDLTAELEDELFS